MIIKELELRMYLVVRGDLIEDVNLVFGKFLGQAGHAFGTAMRQADSEIIERYYADNQPKIVIKCKNLAALTRAETECKEFGLNCFVVTDAARTIFSEPTQTCMAIGPCYREDLPKFVQKMQLL
jgi:PTH2 family peptidyl-tRNA hydrolase